ncbi:MAG: DoxX family membrane protein [Mucilaginibacter polytrichastri]|nr:DoxX family membrane protein [Mucilaginibacter polytrichastri]
MKRNLLIFCRVFVGILFIFSGLIKENDPLGFSYKLEEYFSVFHLQFLDPLALSLSVILCVLEVLLGAALLLGAYMRQTAWWLLLLTIFFTFLTGYSAIFKVVQHCGCFGDAIPLTPWQSFIKDLILLALVIVIFRERGSVRPVFASPALRIGTLLLAAFFTVFFPLWVVRHLPVIDFLPYKVGANIPEEMRIPAGASPSEYEIMYTLRNSKTGETKKMGDKEYLKSGIWKDNAWEISGDPEQRLVKQGFEPKIPDLQISDAQGTDYTKEIVANPFYNLVIVANDLESTSEPALRQLNALALDLAENYNIRSVLLTSASAESAENMSKKLALVFEIFYADGVPLKSMVRANPGILLLRDGTVTGKWNFRDMPDYQTLVNNYLIKE